MSELIFRSKEQRRLESLGFGAVLNGIATVQNLQVFKFSNPLPKRRQLRALLELHAQMLAPLLRQLQTFGEQRITLDLGQRRKSARSFHVFIQLVLADHA